MLPSLFKNLNGNIQYLNRYYEYLTGDSFYMLIDRWTKEERSFIQENIETRAISEICDGILFSLHNGHSFEYNQEYKGEHNQKYNQGNKEEHNDQDYSQPKSIIRKNPSINKKIKFNDQIMTTGKILKNNIGNALFNIIKYHIHSIANINEIEINTDEISAISFYVYCKFKRMMVYRKKDIKKLIKKELSKLKRMKMKYYDEIKEDKKVVDFCNKLIDLIKERYEEYSRKETREIMDDIEIRMNLVFNYDLI